MSNEVREAFEKWREVACTPLRENSRLEDYTAFVAGYTTAQASWEAERDSILTALDDWSAFNTGGGIQSKICLALLSNYQKQTVECECNSECGMRMKWPVSCHEERANNCKYKPDCQGTGTKTKWVKK